MPSDAAVLTMPKTMATMPSAVARVEVHRVAAPVLAAWAELETAAPCSIYQTRAWLLPWVETIGRSKGIAPLYVLVRGHDERPLALLCLGVVRPRALKIARWLGGTDANFNMPLVRRGAGLTAEDVVQVLRQTARACGSDRPDLFHLANQPHEWGGRANVMASLAHAPSPTPAFGTGLDRDAEQFLARKLSKDTRKKLRKKEAKLTEHGALTHLVVKDADERAQVLDCFFAQKLARFRTKRIVTDFGTTATRAFVEAASHPDGAGIELHALLAGERIVAIYGGAAHDGQWSGMFNSFDADEEIAKSSPGDLLLMRIVAKACRDGLDRFDLGIGEARYKAALCDERLALFDSIIPVSARGTIAARLLELRQRTKRLVKAHPRLYAMAMWARALRS